MDDTLTHLAQIIEQRKTAPPATSYVASLHAKGLDSILKKIGEEATELVIAAKNGQAQAIVHETADLWFHTLVMLSAAGLTPADVLLELSRRFNQSGLQEKAGRAC